MWGIKKKLVFSFVGLLLAGVGATTIPVVPTPMEWVVSYETIAFDTLDGDLGLDEYATVEGTINPDDGSTSGGGWYVREVPKEEGQFFFTEDPAKIVGKNKVFISCEKCAYYNEFLSESGKTVRVVTEKQHYDGLRYEMDYPIPAKDELAPILDPPNVDAAIAYDTTANSGLKSAVSSFSYSHTVTGSNPVLTIHVGSRDTANSTDGVVTSLTYNSVSGERVAIHEGQNGGSCACIILTDLWYVKAPSTGTNTVSVTLTGTITNGWGASISLTGVNQSRPLESYNFGGDYNTSLATTTVQTATNESWLIGGVCQGTNTTHTAGSGQTERYDLTDAGAVADCAGTTEGPQSVAGYVGMDGTFGNSSGYAIVAAAFAPVPTGGTTVEYFLSTTTPEFASTPITVFQWTAPTGVTSVTGECWGGGGGGGALGGTGGAGGGGGAYASSNLSVTPGNTYNVVIGNGGLLNGINGSDSYFDGGTDLLADGGVSGSGNTAGTGGTTANSIGNVAEFAGGDGAIGNGTDDTGGGGGGAGGPSGAGGAGTAGSTTVGGAGGAGNNGSGGAGGAGGNGNEGVFGFMGILGGGGGGGGDNGNSGGEGGNWGGGGGGGESSESNSIYSGVGAPGMCRLTYTATADTGLSPKVLFRVGQTIINGQIIIP